MNNILGLDSKEAKSFFLKGKSYCDIDLPTYFVFEELLLKISNEIDGKNIKDYGGTNPRDYSDVNYTLLNNKDGKYAWRPLQLIHPVLYVSLVHKITESNNWSLIRKRFREFQSDEKIKCLSIPVRSESDDSDKAELIKSWWENVEQESIRSSLDYEYLLETDITDCYGSIYTHSIAWVLHEKNIAKSNRRDNNLLGNIIDNLLQDMSYGQTNGIPQGSTLMDFIAEVVLGYADLLLSEKLKEKRIIDFRIIRYRDDYRVFVNNPNDADEIAKCLTELLSSLNFKINASKTRFSNEVVKNSLKSDKYFWFSNSVHHQNKQKQLLLIHSISQKYPNSGVLNKLLDSFYRSIKSDGMMNDDIVALIAISVDISVNNPRTVPVASAILSSLILEVNEELERVGIMKKILKRYSRLPNTGFLEIWIQRVCLKSDTGRSFQENLCKKVSGESNIQIWNSEWLGDKLRDLISGESIIDKNIIDSLPPVIEPKEFELFNVKSY